MKRTILRNSLLLTALIIIAGCSSPLKVTSDYDKTADFSKLKTYALYGGLDTSRAVSQFNKERIKTAIKKEMNKKGYTESSNPDMLINAIALTKETKQVIANTTGVGYGGVYRPYYWGGAGMSTTTFDETSYTDGSLIIDIIDVAQKKLLWQGVGNKQIDAADTKDPEALINEAVMKILANFPPGAAKK